MTEQPHAEKRTRDFQDITLLVSKLYVILNVISKLYVIRKLNKIKCLIYLRYPLLSTYKSLHTYKSIHTLVMHARVHTVY